MIIIINKNFKYRENRKISELRHNYVKQKLIKNKEEELNVL